MRDVIVYAVLAVWAGVVVGCQCDTAEPQVCGPPPRSRADITIVYMGDVVAMPRQSWDVVLADSIAIEAWAACVVRATGGAL